MKWLAILWLSATACFGQDYFFDLIRMQSGQSTGIVCPSNSWVQLIPNMVAANNPASGLVTQSANWTPSLGDWATFYAFSGTTDACFSSFSGSTGATVASGPSWIEFQFTGQNPYAGAWSFGIPLTGDSASVITVAGSSDGATFQTLDAFNNPGGLGCTGFYTYRFLTNSVRYSYYRFSWVAAGQVSFTGVQLYGCQ